MEELALFPLELVLFPTERIPLHIFEPRYKELIRECLDEKREFGLVLADEDGLREIGTRAAVVEVLERFDDGRLNVLVEGRERFRLMAETEGGRPFRTGEVEPVRDADDPPAAAEIDRALDVFGQLVAVTASEEVGEPNRESKRLSFELAARVDFGPELKQEILELLSERERLVRLSDLFDVAVQGLRLEQEVRERASGNGKVEKRPQLLGGGEGPDSTS